MLSKKSNIKEYLNNKMSQTCAALGFVEEGQYCYKLNFSPLPMESRGKGVKVFSWFLFLLVWCDWGGEVLRPSTLHIVKMGIPLSKGEGRVRVQHGGLKSYLRPIRIIGWVLTQQKHFGNFLYRQEIVLGEVLTNCAQTLDPHQEIQVLAALKPNSYPLPMERRGKSSMKYSRPSTLYIVKMGIPLSKGEGRVRVQHGRLKNLLRPIRIIGWVLTQQKHFGNFLSCQEIVLAEGLTPREGGCKNLSRPICSINASMEGGLKKC